MTSSFFLFFGCDGDASSHVSSNPVPRFNVANLDGLCHKRNLIARLIKGCRVDVRADCFA